MGCIGLRKEGGRVDWKARVSGGARLTLGLWNLLGSGHQESCAAVLSASGGASGCPCHKPLTLCPRSWAPGSARGGEVRGTQKGQVFQMWARGTTLPSPGAGRVQPPAPSPPEQQPCLLAHSPETTGGDPPAPASRGKGPPALMNGAQLWGEGQRAVAVGRSSRRSGV